MKYRDITPFGVRFPDDIKEKIHKGANANRRSMNAEILSAVQEYYEGGGRLKTATDGDLIEELIRRWGRDAVFIRLGKDGEKDQ